MLKLHVDGTLPVTQGVDASGSFILNVPLSTPHSRFKPALSALYHSARVKVSTLGKGCTLMGIPTIERTPATVAQDGFRGVVGYDTKDRFILDGQRLVQIGDTQSNKTEFRFEVEQWARVFAHGDDLANPVSWEQHLPDGTIRKFGCTEDSNVKVDTQTGGYTRVWAINEASDPFSNYITFRYTTVTKGAFYPELISYGGNKNLALEHQKRIVFIHEVRNDKVTEYFGGFRIRTEKRLQEIQSFVKKDGVWGDIPTWRYQFDFDYAPLTQISRVTAITLSAGLSYANPLKFDWSDCNPKVFDAIKDVAVLSPKGTSANAICMDIDGKGYSDMVIASKRPNPDNENTPELYLDIYLSDSEGKLSDQPTKGSGFTKLTYPSEYFLPLDADGDGQTDLLHIAFSESTYKITILASIEDATDESDKFNKFVPQWSTEFTPSVTKGSFYTGDFEGNGNVGLVYIYTVATSSPDEAQLCFVQFSSDGRMLTAKPVEMGPLIKSPKAADNDGKDNIRIVAGDLKGEGIDDIFILTPMTSSGLATGWMIYLLLSDATGALKYQTSDPLKEAGKAVTQVSDVVIIPFKADSDRKTGLLFASKSSNGFLQLQLLRSTGTTLLPDATQTATTAKYEGDISVAKLIQHTSEVVNVAKQNGKPIISVFKFDGEVFQTLSEVTQPGDLGLFQLRYADLRGIGRSDLLFNCFKEDDPTIIVRALQCSGSHPKDCIITSRNGIGGFTTVEYAPLTDPKVYTATDKKYRQPTALMNGVANNSTVTSTSASATQLYTAEPTRTTLVYYPSFVVHNISSNYGSHNPISVNNFKYTYSNAELSFDGRGWLGFQTVTKSDETNKTMELTKYLQTFPLIGRVALSQKMDSEDSTKLLDIQKKEYTWTSWQDQNDKKYTIRLEALKETYYEGGVKAYHVDVTYVCDDYGNTTSTTIQSSQAKFPILSIEATYDAPNPDKRWVVRNKRTEDARQGSTFLRRLKQEFYQNTFACKKRSIWVRDDIWSTTNLAFDEAGYPTDIQGPWSHHQTFTYQNMHAVVTITTDTESTPDETTEENVTRTLTETTTYDPATYQPLVVEEPNGFITRFSYDILGRTVEVKQGTDMNNLSTIEDVSFYMEGDSIFVESRKSNNGLTDENEGMRKEIVRYDSLMRPLSVRKSRPDDLEKFICVDTRYDGLNRVTHRSREYSCQKEPPSLDQQFQYTYDKHSRLIKEVFPPNKAGGKSVTHDLTYLCEGGIPGMSEVHSDGSSDGTTSVLRTFDVIPHADTPSPGKFVKLCVAQRQDEKRQNINTTFDGLARPIEVVDHSRGVVLQMNYDGLSRQVERKLIKSGSQRDGVGEMGNDSTADVTFSHLRLVFDDTNLSSTLLNVLTKSTVVSKTDFCLRLVEKRTNEETLTFEYDRDKFSLGKLSSVKSTQGIRHTFSYDDHGNHALTALEIDGRVLNSKFDWTQTRQLKRVTNPDGSSILRTYYPDGLTLKLASLFKAKRSMATVRFLDPNVYGLPLTRSFGNGITSQIELSNSGMLTLDALTLADRAQPSLKQEWKYDPFNKIEGYTIGAIVSTYAYDPVGQLYRSNIGNFTSVYQDGIIVERGDVVFESKPSDGWQLESVLDAGDDAPLYAYKYSKDGNTISKTAGDVTTNMTYDTQGRLNAIVSHTDFLYDYTGRLLKATAANGDSVLYVSPTFEIEVKNDKGREAKAETWTSYLVEKGRRASYSESRAPSAAEDAIAIASESGVVYYFHIDQLGSTVAVSDSEGSIVTQYRYDALGNVKVLDSGKDIARYKFCGKERFGSFYYFGSRFYDSELGRFLTLDNYPIDLDNISPGSFNLYGFSLNDPVNVIDANGNNAVPAYHWVVDGFLIASGLAETLTAIVILNPALGVAGGASLNSGISGFITDLSASSSNNSSTGSWVFQLGLGAVIGGSFGGLSVGIGLGIREGSRELLSVATRNVFKKAAIQNFFSVGLEAGLGAAAGATQQILTNAYEGDPLGKDVKLSAAVGSVAGLVVAGGLQIGQNRWNRIAWAGQRAGDRVLSSARTGLPYLRTQLAQGRYLHTSVVRDVPAEIHYFARGVHFPYIDSL